jgi:hypothetical protein
VGGVGRAFWVEMDAVFDMLDGLTNERAKLVEAANG